METSTVVFKGETYPVMRIKMYDADFKQNFDYLIGPQTLNTQLSKEDYSGEAGNIDREIFSYVPLNILKTMDPDKIINELRMITGLDLRRPTLWG